MTCIHAMPKNPFLTTPAPNQSPWTQKQENPFLRNSGNNMFLGPGTGTSRSTSVAGTSVADTSVAGTSVAGTSVAGTSVAGTSISVAGTSISVAGTSISVAGTSISVAGTRAIAADAPIRLDEETFPSLLPPSALADCNKKQVGGLNFKLAVSTGLGTGSTSLGTSSTSLDTSSFTGRNSRNMFLCPQRNAHAYDAYARDAYARDAADDAADDADAYDSAYTKYYNDRR